MDKVIEFLKGKKQYAVAAVMAAIAFWEGMHPGAQLPSWVPWLMGAFGLAANRAAIDKTTK